MEQKKIFWTVFGVLFLISTYYLFDLMEKKQEDDFIDSSYQYVLKIKPKQDDSNKGYYSYPCIDLQGKTTNFMIGSRVFYNAVSIGDTIEKKKGVSFILLKRENLILKIPITFNYINKVDIVLVR